MKKMDMGAGKVSPRKGMAMGKGKGAFPSGNFGVKDYHAQHGGMPSDNKSVGHAPMADGNRAVGMPVKGAKGMHPAQAAPKHG